MRNKFLLLALLLVSTNLFAQVSFTDDFEAYTVGSALGPQSPNWTTWSGTQGGADDINVTNIDAHSGTKSLYFTSTAASGGPSDIVLPFSGPHATGTFTFTSWFKVSTGKGGYFNFQGTNTAGNTFLLNTFFNPNGTIQIDNVKEVVLNNTYTQNVWFELKLVANLNTNSWELFLDNVSKGTFQCETFSVASIDYYATGTTDAFYVDDVSYAQTPYTMPTLNGAVGLINVANGIVTQIKKPNLTVRNLGTTAITNFDIALNANGTITNQSFTGLNIASGASYVCNLTNNVTLIQGLNTITATISNVNGNATDGDATDNSKTFTFTPVKAGDDKLVVAEEATGTWCGWCPRGAVYLGLFDKEFDGFFQGIAVHNNDPMEDSTYDAGLGTKISGYPSALVDRGTDMDPSQMYNDFITRVQLTPVAKIKNGANYNATSGQLDVSVSTTFKVATTNAGSYKVACVIIEDSVKGTASGYNQANYYAGGGSGVMGGYETKSNPVPAAQMQYDHVARAIAPNFGGLANQFPTSVVANSVYASNFTFNVSAWNKNKLHIVALLIAPDGKIENAKSSTIDEAVANGFVLGLHDNVTKAEFLSVYPNPANETMNLQINATSYAKASIKVIDLMGNVLMTSTKQINNGTNIIPVSLKSLATGNYLISVTMDDKIQTIPFTVK